MSCPICGPVCRCIPENGVGSLRASSGDERRIAPSLIDPDAYDASEQQFTASLDQPGLDQPAPEPPAPLASTTQADQTGPLSPQADAPPEPSIFQGYHDPAAWKAELAAKLDDYRRRHRPRAPHYPSLQLQFETDPGWRTAPPEPDHTAFASRESTALDRAELAPAPQPQARRNPAVGESVGRLIEFPRAASVPQSWIEELAEPVMDRPRIMDVPETELPPPALGGILMEPAPAPEEQGRYGIEVPMLAAPMGRRCLAGFLDAVLVAAAVALFAGVFVQVAGVVPALRPALIGVAALSVFFWFGFQHLLIVYAGTTPGLKLAGLELSRFDGSHATRRQRRWRWLASLLSGASLGLGYLWCFLDEDQMCWHDRITRTHLAPKP
jgi:uncharacterized RDD family membrane protein YckC